MKSTSLTSQKSKKTIINVDEIYTYIVIPPDGGWGWVVVLVAFFANFIADGSMTTYGIFKMDIKKSLKCTDSQIILPSSIMTGVYYMAGPFICAMTNKFGFRLTALIGGVLSAGGYVLAAYSPNLALFTLGYGAFAGTGFSMTYIASILVVGFYFEKWRALATSISVCGSAMGTTLFPVIFEGVLGNYTWKVRFLILAGLCLCITFFYLTYKPIPPRKVVQQDDKKTPTPTTTMTTKISFDSLATEDETLLFGKYHNVTYPTAAEIHPKNPVILEEDARSDHDSFLVTRMSIRSNRSMRSRRGLSVGAPGGTSSIDEEYNCCQRCLGSIQNRFCWCCVKRRLPQRPMYRDDILFNTTLEKIPEYKGAKHKKKHDYHLHVTRVTTYDDVEETYVPCVICPQSVKRTLSTMLDLSLFTNGPFVLLNISAILTVFGYYIPFLYITESAKKNKMNPTVCTYLLSAMGISNAIGRILSGVLSSLPKLKATVVSLVGILIAGLAVLAIPFSYTVYVQYSCSIIYGLMISVAATLRPIIIVDILGLERLTNAFGIYLLFQGIGCMIAITLSGFLLEVTHTYRTVYLFAGSSLTVSALLLIPLQAMISKKKSTK